MKNRIIFRRLHNDQKNYTGWDQAIGVPGPTQERLLQHLWTFEPTLKERMVPDWLTQAGIALALGIDQPHVSRLLRPLERIDMVSHDLQRIRNVTRRRRVYRLTRKGRGFMRRTGVGSDIGWVGDPEMAGPVPPCFGRDKEVRRLTTWLGTGNGIMIITGSAGIGKTNLVHQAVASLTKEPLQVRLLPAGDWEELRELLGTIGTDSRDPFLSFLLEKAEDPGPCIPVLARHLAIRQAPLIIDRAERLSADILAMLSGLTDSEAGTEIQVILQSREVIRLPASATGIQRLRLGPLGSEARAELLESISGSTPGTAPVGGNPRAILHGANVVSGSPLDTGPHLTPVERQVLQTIAIHRLPVTGRALAHLPVSTDTVADLAERRLVLEVGGKGNLRYWVAEAIAETIRADPTAGGWRDLHSQAARYYRDLRTLEAGIERVYHLALAGHHDRALKLLDLRSAELFDRSDYRTIRRLLDGIQPEALDGSGQVRYLLLVATVREALGDLEEASGYLEEALELVAPGAEPILTARVIRRQGRIARRRLDLDEAIACYQRAATALGDADDPAERAAILDEHATVLLRRKDEAGARALIGQALAISKEHGDQALVARMTHSLGNLALVAGELEVAAQHFQDTLTHLEAAPSRSLETLALSNLGLVLNRRGEFGAAARVLERSCQLGEESGDIRVAFAHNNLAFLYQRTGAVERAREHASRTLELASIAGMPLLVSTSNNILGHLDLLSGEPTQAQDRFLVSLVVRQEHHDGAGQAGAWANLGEAYQAEGAVVDARIAFTTGAGLGAGGEEEARNYLGLLEVALAQDPTAGEVRLEAERLDIPPELEWRRAILVAKGLAGKDPTQARTILRALVQETGFPRPRALLWRALAEIEELSGRRSQVLTAWNRALREARKAGDLPLVTLSRERIHGGEVIV